MTQKQQKIISAVLVSLAVVLGLQVLIYIVNLNQISIYIQLCFIFWFYLSLKITVFYDLHYKNLALAPKKQGIVKWFERDVKSIFLASTSRLAHIFHWKYLRNWVNYLILPGFIFWSTAGLFYVNLGQTGLQQIFAVISSIALILNFWYLKEAFLRKEAKVGHDIFSVLSAIKIYALALTFGMALALMRRFCEAPMLFTLGVFSFSFLFTYQSLFQANLLKVKTLLGVGLIALIQASLAYFVYMYWGLNYFTAAVFQIAIYNFLWTCYHHYLEGDLSKKIFLENLFLTLIIIVLVISNTNFKARILNAC